MYATLPRHDIVLVGAGHTNAHVLRMWRMNPIEGARLTCVSDHALATYSGMLPGTLAGLYPRERMQIDLVRLCAAANVRFIHARATGLDLAGRQLLLEDRPPLPFDVLSIGIGSLPRAGANVELDGNLVLPIKPMQTFLARLDRRLHGLRHRAAGAPLRVAVVGGGAGGIEIAFCLPFHVRQLFGKTQVDLVLVDAHARLLAELPERTGKVVVSRLVERGVRIVLGRTVTRAEHDMLELDDGQQIAADLVLWATSARAPAMLARFGLPVDADGFLLTRHTLQTVADAPIFAVGDAGTIRDTPTPKSGVYAVRQGPVLWRNLRHTVAGEPLEPYEPQQGFLKLLATGDRRAILAYKGRTFEGAWCWKLKDYIDSRFMDKYQDYEPAPMHAPPALNGQAPVMRCAGCGSKLSGSVLSRALKRLDIPTSEHVLLGLESPDDAAIVRTPGGAPVVATADFFTAFVDDPYLVGRVAVLNAASDLFAVGARPLAALALVTIPLGHERQQEQILYDVLAGALAELKRMGATLVGGHTIEGPELTVGFSMLAEAGPACPRRKGGLRPGDRLVLTKPLGSGVLLAAHQRAMCRAEWMDGLMRLLLTSNQAAAAMLDEFDVRGVTDVTGFGLAGHLLEMLEAANLATELRLADVPLAAGAAEAFAAGIESTLAPANRAAEAQIEADPALQAVPQYAALFDPQTSGGLLLGVPAAEMDPVLRRLAAVNEFSGVVVGTVVEPGARRRRLRLI